MKTKLLLFFFFVNAFTYSQSLETGTLEIPVISSEDSFDDENYVENIVYVCTGAYAYAYHSSAECAGLNNCQADIKYTSESIAVYDLDRKPCCRCWSNVSDGCVDDNKQNVTGGGGGNDEALAYAAIAVVAASAAILSNDLYLYPVFSFYQGNNRRNTGSTDMGWAFGFRKTFKKSALEYGASFLNSTYGYSNYSYQVERWGFHLNYVHHLISESTPSWLDLYLGPSINYVENFPDDFGYGGVTGVQMRIFDRLKFDVRYERTTLTNQVQAGLIFKYQKKYFWRK